MWKTSLVVGLLCAFGAAVELAGTLPFLFTRQDGSAPHAYLLAMAILSAVGLGLGVLRHYWDIYTHRSVRGISFFFVGLDAAGDLTSLLSVGQSSISSAINDNRCQRHFDCSHRQARRRRRCSDLCSRAGLVDWHHVARYSLQSPRVDKGQGKGSHYSEWSRRRRTGDGSRRGGDGHRGQSTCKDIVFRQQLQLSLPDSGPSQTSHQSFSARQ